MDSNDEDDDDLPDAHDGLALVGKSRSRSRRKREAEHREAGSPSDAGGGGGGEDDLDTRLQNQQNLERNHKNHRDEERNHSDAKKALENHRGLVANGKVKTGNFRLGCDDSDDDKDDIMPGEDKIDDDNDDPGVVNPTFLNDDEDDEGGRGDATSSVSTRSSPEPSPLHSPRLSFRSVASGVGAGGGAVDAGPGVGDTDSGRVCIRPESAPGGYLIYLNYFVDKDSLKLYESSPNLSLRGFEKGRQVWIRMMYIL